LKVKPDKLMYVSEMTAAAAAVGVFIAVYIVGFVQTGALMTFLFAWIPAALLAWLAARLLRAAVQAVLDISPSHGFLAFGATDDDMQPIIVRPPRRRTRGSKFD
jgi:zinc transporter ZupT